MKALDKETAIARMNTFGRKDIPFLFIIDYTQECSYVEALDKIDASACLYQFRGTGNAPIADTRYAGPTDWEFTPPVTCRLPPFFRHRKAELAGRQQLPDQSDMQSASPYQPCAKGHFPIFPCPVQTMAERQLRLLLTRNIRPHGRRENQVLPHERDN